MLFLASALALMLQTASNTPDFVVHNVPELRQAISQAAPGSRIALAPGEYEGGLYFSNIRGEADKPIIIAALDAAQPPVIRGGNGGLHLSDVAYLELHNLVLTGARANGLNIDDGGSYDTPSHHILLRGIRVHDVGSDANHDGIKLSGVDGFRLEQCVVERWGIRGQGIDMVGCHDGVIEDCTIRYEDDKGSGVQTKGGSRNIRIRWCHFDHAGMRAVNVGGSTGLQYFRPPLVEGQTHAEAQDIAVEGCTFIGSHAPIAFVGVDGAVVRFNTFYQPGRWVLRILQETRAEGFVPSRQGVFSDNLIVFDSGALSTTVNIGDATAPESFVFERNWWYAQDNPANSHPTLPTAEINGTYGQNPQLRNPEAGDFRLLPNSPAAHVGATALGSP